jgi:hypothetical protein
MRSPRTRLRLATDSDLIDIVVKGLLTPDCHSSSSFALFTAGERAIRELQKRARGGCVCADCFQPYDVGANQLVDVED